MDASDDPERRIPPETQDYLRRVRRLRSTLSGRPSELHDRLRRLGRAYDRGQNADDGPGIANPGGQNPAPSHAGGSPTGPSKANAPTTKAGDAAVGSAAGGSANGGSTIRGSTTGGSANGNAKPRAPKPGHSQVFSPGVSNADSSGPAKPAADPASTRRAGGRHGKPVYDHPLGVRAADGTWVGHSALGFKTPGSNAANPASANPKSGGSTSTGDTSTGDTSTGNTSTGHRAAGGSARRAPSSQRSIADERAARRAVEAAEAAESAFADLVRRSLDGPVVRYSRRQDLLHTARHLGIGRFAANLIIARVQHQLRTADAEIDGIAPASPHGTAHDAGRSAAWSSTGQVAMGERAPGLIARFARRLASLVGLTRRSNPRRSNPRPTWSQSGRLDSETSPPAAPVGPHIAERHRSGQRHGSGQRHRSGQRNRLDAYDTDAPSTTDASSDTDAPPASSDTATRRGWGVAIVMFLTIEMLLLASAALIGLSV